MNENTSVSIKTPFGQTERDSFHNIVQQGGSWGGILCANSVGSIEKKASETKCYTKLNYKEAVQIPMLSYIDDIENASKCGVNTLENNIIITNLVEAKRLNFNVGNTTKKSKCERLFIVFNVYFFTIPNYLYYLIPLSFL